MFVDVCFPKRCIVQNANPLLCIVIEMYEFSLHKKLVNCTEWVDVSEY